MAGNALCLVISISASADSARLSRTAFTDSATPGVVKALSLGSSGFGIQRSSRWRERHRLQIPATDCLSGFSLVGTHAFLWIEGAGRVNSATAIARPTK